MSGLSKLNADNEHLNKLKAAALQYVKDGYPIVPMGFNSETGDYKRPLVRWREADGPARTEKAVEDLFDRYGKRIFGVATIVERHILVDFDTEDSHKLFRLQPAPTIKTGKGRHMWYASDLSIQQNGPLDLSQYEQRDGKKYQVETYTEKRLEILPPSLHHSGVMYEWELDYSDFSELSPLPEDLKLLCNNKTKKVSAKKSDIFRTIREGERHIKLKEACFYFFNKHKGDEKKILRSVQDWNSEYCNPAVEKTEIRNMVDWTVENFDAPSGKKEKEPKQSQAILEYIEESNLITLFHDQDRIGFARLNSQKGVNVPIHSQEFTEFLGLLAYRADKSVLTDYVCKEVQSVLNAKAVYESPKHTLHHRVSQMGESEFYYDLCNEAGEAVKITKAGWAVESDEKVQFLFKRGAAIEQPKPVEGGDLRQFLDFVNLKDEDEKMLFLCTLPVRMIRDIDQPIVYIYGPAGSAKTTLLKLTKDLLDPSQGGISMPVKKLEHITPLLNQTWIFANDNISHINDELSDFFCVMATGAESARRTLYKDSEVTVHRVKNPAYMTGINVEASNSDLLSRLLIFKTEALGKGNLKNKKDLFEKYELIKPQLLGAIFDTLVKAANIKQSLPQQTEFRMTEYALWGAACAEVLGYGAENFEGSLQRAMKARAYDAIQSSSAGRALLKYLEENELFEGTMTKLLKTLKNLDIEDDFIERWSETVANNPESLSKKLRELENSLAEIGISIDFKRTATERLIVIGRTDNH